MIAIGLALFDHYREKNRQQIDSTQVTDAIIRTYIVQNLSAAHSIATQSGNRRQFQVF